MASKPSDLDRLILEAWKLDVGPGELLVIRPAPGESFTREQAEGLRDQLNTLAHESLRGKFIICGEHFSIDIVRAHLNS